MLKFIKLNVLLEIVIWITLWFLFKWLDEMDPFVREISPQEVWKYQYPLTPNIVPSTFLWIIITFFPLIYFTFEYLIQKLNHEPIIGLWALSLCYGLNGFLTSYLKLLVGRPRPDFYERCFPNGSGNDFKKCTGNRQLFMDGRKSFPSGHASFSFCCATFMSLYVARRLKLFKEPHRDYSWKLCVCIFPFLVATTIAISRTCDYHHHYEDVIGGGLIGILTSYLTFKLYLPPSNDDLSSIQEK